MSAIIACSICIFLLIYQPHLEQLAPPSECPNRADFLDSNRWQLNSQNRSIQKLWEKTELRPPLTEFGNYGLVSYLDQAIFYSQYWKNENGQFLPSCSEEEIFSFDLHLGTIKWRYSLSQQYDRPFKSLKALDDGVLIVLDGILIKLDPEGKYIWSNEGFASREINQVYWDTNLYIPAKDKIYVISSDTGLLLNTLEAKNPIGVVSGHIIRAIDDQNLKITSSDGQSSFDVHLDDAAPIDNAWLAPFIDVSDDTIFIYDQFGTYKSIEAYSLSKGNLIWRSNIDFQGLPVLSNRYLFIYADQQIKILDAGTGLTIDTLNFNRKDSTQDTVKSHNVSIVVNNNVIILNIRDTWDILALELQ